MSTNSLIIVRLNKTNHRTINWFSNMSGGNTVGFFIVILINRKIMRKEHNWFLFTESISLIQRYFSGHVVTRKIRLLDFLLLVEISHFKHAICTTSDSERKFRRQKEEREDKSFNYRKSVSEISWPCVSFFSLYDR